MITMTFEMMMIFVRPPISDKESVKILRIKMKKKKHMKTSRINEGKEVININLTGFTRQFFSIYFCFITGYVTTARKESC